MIPTPTCKPAAVVRASELDVQVAHTEFGTHLNLENRLLLTREKTMKHTLMISFASANGAAWPASASWDERIKPNRRQGASLRARRRRAEDYPPYQKIQKQNII